MSSALLPPAIPSALFSLAEHLESTTSTALLYKHEGLGTSRMALQKSVERLHSILPRKLLRPLNSSELFANFLGTVSCIRQVHAPIDEGFSSTSCRAVDASLSHTLIYEDQFVGESRMLRQQFLACHLVEVAS